jgi:PAS domain S-box-containing protein
MPSAAIEWKAVSRIENINGRRVLRYLSADPASQQSCAVCHNSYESTPEVVARRVSDGIPVGKQWREHQLLGALSITIPLDRAEQLAGSQINETAIFIFGILVASFLAMFWFNWRLTRQERSLRETENQLKSAELETRSANALLQANQGIKRAYTELSTYMRAIDQHAIVSVADRQGRIVEVNTNCSKSAARLRELIGQTPHTARTRRKEFREMWAKLNRGEIWRGTICNRTKAGDLYWVDSTIMPLKDAAGCVHRYISIRIDITERKRAEQDMLRMATHDSLTGLANRSLLLDRIHQTLEIYKRTTALAAVLFIDLDQFKAINDSLGHRPATTCWWRWLRLTCASHRTPSKGGMSSLSLCQTSKMPTAPARWPRGCSVTWPYHILWTATRYALEPVSALLCSPTTVKTLTPC